MDGENVYFAGKHKKSEVTQCDCARTLQWLKLGVGGGGGGLDVDCKFGQIFIVESTVFYLKNPGNSIMYSSCILETGKC